MTTADERIAALEARLRAVEDHLAIIHVVASYGPLVDSGDADGAAALWTEDGVYDVDTGTYAGHDGIAAMVESRQHQGLLSRGCAHVSSTPQVRLREDTAVAITHSQLLMRDEQGGFRVLRATAHRWELVRTSGGWRVEQRTSRLLDGSAAARELLRSPDLP
jgi:uncharacterized protein (TIGR02246 family)